MLSPGTEYQKVPKLLRDNLDFRKWLLGRANANPRARAALVDICRHDILFAINVFGFTYDPRLDQGHKSLPMLTYPFQDRALLRILECIEDGRDLVIEKSRDMGVSWLCCYAMDWLFLSQPGNSFLMVSRKEDLVDAIGDPDCLFWKLDFIHQHMPEWALPSIDRRRLHFENRDNGSTMDGESTTAAAGVGGRRTAMFIDEFSRIEEGYQLLAGTADTTNCRIFNFTPWGTSNAAYRLAKRADIRKLRLHWSEHPVKAAGLYRYNEDTRKVDVLDTSYQFPLDFVFIMDGKLRSPWYDDECRRRANDREIAEMLDIDYQGSQYQFFDRSMILDLQRTYCRPPVWEGDIAFDPDTAKPHGLIAVKGGPLRLWMQPKGDWLPKDEYAIGGDISTGSGATNSCLSIGKRKTGEKIGEYVSPYFKADAFALRAVALCWLFADADGEGAKFAWEMQGPGLHFGKRVIELGYRNVYYRTLEHQLNKKVSDTPGWYPSDDNRRILLEDYRSKLGSRKVINPSTEALEETLFFMHTAKGKVEHSAMSDTTDPTGARENHGDRVIADCLMVKMFGAGEERGGRGEGGHDPDNPPLGSLAWRQKMNQVESDGW